MIKSVIISIFLAFLVACAGNKKIKNTGKMPACLQTKIKAMIADPHEGSPLSITRFSYRNQTVFYLVSPCCDKYNIVYDSVCNILGYPDGGYTGKGDGKMNDFFNEATNKKLIWQKEKL